MTALLWLKFTKTGDLTSSETEEEEENDKLIKFIEDLM